MLRATEHPAGSHRFLPAISPYSAGFAANPGYAITALAVRKSRTLENGFLAIDEELRRRGLPASALAGLQLRSPGAFSFDAFQQFNLAYNTLLNQRGLILDGVNPISRTNVIPVADGPTQPIIEVAFIVHPASDNGGTDFVVAGAGEIPGELDPKNIVARGDLSPNGMNAKVTCVIDIMNERLTALGYDGSSPTEVNVYTVHEIPKLARKIAERLPSVNRHGFTHWITKPPVEEIEFEMDCNRYSHWVEL